MTHPEQAAEGRDGSVVAYHERIHAPLVVWLVATALAAALAVAYGYRLGLLAGLLTFAVAELGVVALLLTTAPLVVVDDVVFRAGRARLPLRHVGRIAPLDADRTRDARGAKADPTAFLCTRGWVSTSVLVEVDDPEDPHPYWLVSTRHGRALAPGARGRPRPGSRLTSRRRTRSWQAGPPRITPGGSMSYADDDLLDDADELVEAPTALKVAAPLIAIGVAWAVPKALGMVYTRATGTHPPRASDPDARMSRLLLWAATTAAAIAVVNVLVDRLTVPRPPAADSLPPA